MTNNGRKKTASSRERFGFRNGARVTKRSFVSVERVNEIASRARTNESLRKVGFFL